jgi:hypothetical protein
MRTFDYNLETLKSFIKAGQEKMAAALKAKVSPEEELTMYYQDLCSIIAEAHLVSRSKYVELVGAVAGDKGWGSSAVHAWDMETERSGKAE